MNVIKLKPIIAFKTNGRCFYCNKSGVEIDHFIARYYYRSFSNIIKKFSFGEMDDIQNLFLACLGCNRKKWVSLPDDFTKSSYKLIDRYYRANRRVGVFI